MKTPGRRRRKKKTADTAQKNIVISWHTLGFAEKTTRCESVNMKPETTKTFDIYYIASLSFRTRDSRKKKVVSFPPCWYSVELQYNKRWYNELFDIINWM